MKNNKEINDNSSPMDSSSPMDNGMKGISGVIDKSVRPFLDLIDQLRAPSIDRR